MLHVFFQRPHGFVSHICSSAEHRGYILSGDCWQAVQHFSYFLAGDC